MHRQGCYMINASQALTFHKFGMFHFYLSSFYFNSWYLPALKSMERFHKEMRPELTRRPHLCSFICCAFFSCSNVCTFPKKWSFRFLCHLKLLKSLLSLCQTFWNRKSRRHSSNLPFLRYRSKLKIDHPQPPKTKPLKNKKKTKHLL